MIADNNTEITNKTFRTSVIVISISSCSLSILGSFLIFGTYIFIPEIRNSTRKLVTCLTVADLLTAIGYLVSALAHFSGTQGDVCFTQSVITTYSSLVSFYLTVAIAIHIFATVVSKRDITSTWRFLIYVNLISWIIPGIIVGVAAADKVFGQDPERTGPWCWLKHDHPRTIFWMFFTGKGWEFLCYLLTTTLYVLLKFYLYLKHRYTRFPDIHESLRQEDQNYLYVWFVLYLLRLWGSSRSLFMLAKVVGTNPYKRISDVFMYLQAFGDPGQAFCNSILFCLLDSTVRSYLVNACTGGTQNRSADLPDEQKQLLENSSRQRYSGDIRVDETSAEQAAYVNDDCLTRPICANNNLVKMSTISLVQSNRSVVDPSEETIMI